MKKVFCCALCLLLLFSCKNTEKFTVTYKVYGSDGWEVMSNAKVGMDGEFDSTKVPDNAKIDYSGRKYSFAGWTAKDLSSANPSTATGLLYSGAVVADMTVYAVYVRADKTVTYISWSGAGWSDPGELVYVEANSDFDNAKNPCDETIEYEGRQYNFTGWTNADLSSKNPSTATGELFSGAVTGDMTVYAVYVRADKTVTYVYWTGTDWNNPGESVYVEANSDFDNEKKPGDETIEYEGRQYSFVGWTNADLSSKNPSTATGELFSGAVTGDMAVYAVYAHADALVTYKYWNGTVWTQLGETQIVDINSAFDCSKAPAFDVIKCNMKSTVTDHTDESYDYVFQFNNAWTNTGWTLADEATKTVNDTVSATALSASDKVTGDMTVYAMYKPIKDFVYVEKGKSPKKASPFSESDYLPMDYDFLICDHEVTQAEYNRYDSSHVAYFSSTGSGKGKVSGSTDNLPVEKVSWYDAVEYCNWLSGQEGLAPYYTIDKTKVDPNNTNTSGDDTKRWLVTVNENANGYRLPLEYEWEYAARGGKKGIGHKYSGSDTISDVAWYDTNSPSKTHDVRGKSANELGLYDMSGNVYEWCWDWYSSGMTLGGAISGSCRVWRGGGWLSGADYCGVSRRNYNHPDDSYLNLGFRVVRSCPVGLI